VSDLGVTRSDLFSIPAAGQVQLTTPARDLLSADSYPSASGHPLETRTRDADRTLVEAAFMLHRCHPHDPLCWLGGVYPMPIPPASGTGPTGVTVSWAIHDLLLNWDWRAICSRTCQLINAVPGSVLDLFGDLDRRHGTGSTWLETGQPGQRTEAGR
jgi:hypothetical protein